MSVDLAIKGWKVSEPQTGYPTLWPLWRSPAIFVDNDGDRGEPITDTATSPPFLYYDRALVDEIGEPRKGIEDNRLFAAIENVGDAPADGVTINFSYAPYGVVGGVLYQHVHFKPIATVSSLSFGAHARREVEVPWDLSNPSENNGSLWPAGIGFFDHFCVRVSIDYSGDIEPGNNSTQHNFGNVVSRSPFAPFAVLVANSEKEPNEFNLVAENIPQDWKIRFRGLEKRGQGSHNSSGIFTLNPGEEKLLTFTIMKEENDQQDRDKEKRDTIYISLQSEGKPIGGFSFDAIQFPKDTGKVQERHIPRFVLPYSPAVSFWRL